MKANALPTQQFEGSGKKLHKLSLKKDKIVIDIQTLPSLEKDLRARLAEMKAAPTATAQQKRLQKELKKEVSKLTPPARRWSVK